MQICWLMLKCKHALINWSTQLAMVPWENISPLMGWSLSRREGYPCPNWVTLARGLKIARFYKQDFTGRVACEQALLFGRTQRASRERASETRFARPNRRVCSQATGRVTLSPGSPLPVLLMVSSRMSTELGPLQTTHLVVARAILWLLVVDNYFFFHN